MCYSNASNPNEVKSHIMHSENRTHIGYYFIVAASIIIVLAGLKMSTAILVPFFLSLFLTIILAPLYLWLKEIGLHQLLSLALVMVVLLAFAMTIISLLGNFIYDFSQNIPAYQIKLRQDMSEFFNLLDRWGISIPREDIMNLFSFDTLMQYTAGIIRRFSSFIANFFMIILMVAFMLLEISQFSNKLRQTNSKSLSTFVEFDKNIKHYMFIKFFTSAATGIIIAFSLNYMDIHNAILWGLIAFVFNFIPTIGSILAAIPAIIMALIQFTPAISILVGLIYLGVNVIIGSILEPRILGRGLGISPLIVMLSLIFWGWLLGPIGMLLSVPLTLLIKIALSARPDAQWVTVLLGIGDENQPKGSDS